MDFTVADVLAWARTKPADEAYNYGDGVGGCALCQFLKETGRAADPYVGGGDWADGHVDWGSGNRNQYPQELELPLQAASFGALVARLEKLCPETPITQSEWAAIDAYLTDIETVDA